MQCFAAIERLICTAKLNLILSVCICVHLWLKNSVVKLLAGAQNPTLFIPLLRLSPPDHKGEPRSLLRSQCP